MANDKSKLQLLYEKLVEFEPKLDRLMVALREADEKERENQLREQGGNGRE